MSNWDLMMPGMGLTAIGLAGVFISYAGLAHTFIDGMHALTGLTMFLGLIFLSTGILDGGVSTSNRAKATTLVIVSISLSFGMFAFTLGSFDSTNIFAGILMALVMPAVVMAYLATKMPRYLRPVGSIFALAAGVGIITFVSFGMVGPDPYLLPEQVEIEPVIEPAIAPDAPVFLITMLEGSDIQGNPDYDPDVANVPQGYIVEWFNADGVSHTATSSADIGDTFDTGLVAVGATYQLDTANIPAGEHEYLCTVHPWMTSILVIEGPKEPTVVSMPQSSSIQSPGQVYYDPDRVVISVGDAVLWENDDEAIHTVTGSQFEFDSGLVSVGESFEHTFEEEGTYDYLCTVHPWMTGIVIVE